MHLDDDQIAAVETEALRVFVKAGAGSGKTRVLVARVFRLLDQGVEPHRICAITFTKAAGEEMVRRLTPIGVGELGVEAAPPPFGHVGTIHSLGYRILRSVFRGRTVADSGLSRRLIRKVMVDLRCSPSEWDRVGEITKTISRAKRRMEAFPRWCAHIAVAYQQQLIAQRLFDFDDLVSGAVTLLEDTDRAARWAQTFDHVLVDEAQDVSMVQWDLICSLLRPDSSLFMVGDLGQSIYGWREAAPEYILDELPKRVGEMIVYGLPRNYRSRPEVVDLANHVLHGHRGALQLIPTREAGTPKTVTRDIVSGSAYDEAVAAMGWISEALRTRQVDSPGDIAILTRLNSQLEPFESAAVEAGVPAIIMNGRSFYARADVMDVLAYLKIAIGLDLSPSLDRVYSKPSRRLGKAFLDGLAANGGWSALLAASHPKFVGVRPAFQASAQKLVQTVDTLRSMNDQPPAVLVAYVYDNIGYRDWMLGTEEGRDEADEAAAEVLDSLLKAAARFDRTDDFLHFADQCAHRVSASRIRSVILSTVHRAKGLEWPMVIVGGLQEGLFPHKKGDPSEELRVFYVACTRAREQLILSACTEQPLSRFLNEVIHVPVDPISAGSPSPEGESGEPGADLCDPAAAPGVDRGTVLGEPAPGKSPSGEREGGDVPGSDLHGGSPRVAAASGADRGGRRIAC